MQGNLIFVPALWGPWQDSSYKPWFWPCCSLHPLCWPLGATTHPSRWACRAPGGLTPSRGAPALHHPTADGFSQVLGAHLISPRPCVFPVTFLHLFMLIKATSEATGYLLCCIAELHTPVTAPTSLQGAEASGTTWGAGCGPWPIRIMMYQRRRSESFYLVIVGSADKLPT